MSKPTINALIRNAADQAWAYIPVANRAKWLRGWRATAQTVTRRTLEKKLMCHCDRMRLERDMSDSNPKVGTR